MLNFVGCKILVVGDVMLDEYVVTKISRISPEAPVPVAQIEQRWSVPGGAANVARNLACLGCSTFLAGLRGHDATGGQLQSLLDSYGINTFFAFTDERPTICKTRIVCKGQQLLRLDHEDSGPVALSALEALWQKISCRISEMDAVILSDYQKGVMQSTGGYDSLATRVIAACRHAHVPVLVDPKGTDWSLYAHADCITPNIRELAEVTRTDPEDFPALCVGAQSLMERHHLAHVLLTRSEKGIALIEGDGQYTEIPTQAREVADVSGAGDTVIAVTTACIAKGFSWQEAAKMANRAAGIVVGKAGTSPIELVELREAQLNAAISANSQLARLNSKIHTLEQLLAQVDLWRRAGKKIVFTNGCFDLLHMGHIQLIEEAASQGDKLIVALNADASIKRLKGSARPIQSEKTRCVVMAALEEVNAVVVFEEDTPLRLVEAISPDVLVKGGDYATENIVGAEHVRKTGGRVHVANFMPGFSTTAIINIMHGH